MRALKHGENAESVARIPKICERKKELYKATHWRAAGFDASRVKQGWRPWEKESRLGRIGRKKRDGGK
jgi:hypothetical protein